MLIFEHPWAFALLPLPLLARWLIPARSDRRVAVRVPFMSTLQELSKSGLPVSQRHARLWRNLLLVTLWVLVIASLARPQWLQPPETREQPTRDLLLLVDLSGSMEHMDFKNVSGETVDRLTAVKEVLAEFLQRRKGDRVGLIVFGDAAFVQSPFTPDLELTRQLLEQVQVRMAGPRTALGDAMGLGITLFENSDLPTKTIIALTDGNDTASAVPPEKAADVAADRGITIHTIAVGDPASVGEEKIDEAALRGVARKTGGEFFKASDRDQLATIYTRLDELETVSVETITHRSQVQLFWIPLAVGLLLSLIHEVLRWLKTLRQRRGTGSAIVTRGRVHVNPRSGELELETR